MKKIFWTFIVLLLLIFLFWSYVRLFNKPLAAKIATWFSKCEQTVVMPECNDVVGDLTEQFDVIREQLEAITQKLETDPSSTPDVSVFQTTIPTKVALYYFNQDADGKLPIEQQININSLLPVYRTLPASKNLLVDTVNELIMGKLTADEKKEGFITEFPHPKFKLLGHTLSADGTLTLEFTEVPGFTSGGSARMLMLSTSIEKTMLQFPGVKRVVFNPEEIFQP